MATLIDIGLQKMRHGGSSWSFGSNHYPSGQFPKVSIGITVDECPNTGSRQRNEDNIGKTISCQSTAEDPTSGREEALEQKRSYNVADKMVSTPTWLSTRSPVHAANIPIFEAEKSFVNKSKERDAHKKNVTLVYGRKGVMSESGKRMEEAKMQANLNKGSTIKEHEGTNKFKLNNGDVTNTEKVEFPTKQATEKEKEADKCNNSSLKMKLWEILGTSPLGNIHNTDVPVGTQESNLDRSKLSSPVPCANKENVDPYQSNELKKDINNYEFKKDKNSNEFKKDRNGNEFKKDKNGNELKKDKTSNEFKKDKNSNEFKKDKNSNGLKKDKNSYELKMDNNINEFKMDNNNLSSRAKLKSQQFEENRELRKNLNAEFQKVKTVQNKKNSDTIEDDSESPNQVIRRPVTRSSTKKKASPKGVQKMKSSISKKKPSSPLDSDLRLKSEKNNVFAFDDVEAKAGGLDSCSNSKKSKEKSSEQNNDNYEPPKVHFSKSYLPKSKQNCEKKQESESPNNNNYELPKVHFSKSYSAKGKQDSEIQESGSLNNSYELPKVYFSKSYSAKGKQDSEKKQESESHNKSSFEFMRKDISSVRNQDTKKSSKMLDDSPDNIFRSQKSEKHNFELPPNITKSPLFQMKTHSWGQDDSPPVQKNVFLHANDVFHATKEKKANHSADDSHNPTFATPTSPNVLNTEDFTENIKRFKPSHNSSPESYQPASDVSPESCQPESDAESERGEDDNMSPHKTADKESPLVDVNYEKQQSLFSQTEEAEEDTESQDDDLNCKNHGFPTGFGLANKWFPSPEKSPDNSPISLPKAKKARMLSNAKSSTMMNSPTLPTSSTESEGLVGLREGLEQIPDGGMGRCFAQLALTLKRFKRRMKFETNKRSSEIMSAAADKIRQQLQDFRSQMLDDVEKFTNANKGKRKHLESKFQEEQETLKVIHEKFREEVNQHLSNCKTVLEEIESHNKELKVSAERQKASQRKLMLQAQEAMEAQLNNAEASIAAVHKDAQKKMTGLKRVLKEFMA